MSSLTVTYKISKSASHSELIQLTCSQSNISPIWHDSCTLQIIQEPTERSNHLAAARKNGRRSNRLLMFQLVFSFRSPQNCSGILLMSPKCLRL